MPLKSSPILIGRVLAKQSQSLHFWLTAWSRFLLILQPPATRNGTKPHCTLICNTLILGTLRYEDYLSDFSSYYLRYLLGSQTRNPLLSTMGPDTVAELDEPWLPEVFARNLRMSMHLPTST